MSKLSREGNRATHTRWTQLFNWLGEKIKSFWMLIFTTLIGSVFSAFFSKIGPDEALQKLKLWIGLLWNMIIQYPFLITLGALILLGLIVLLVFYWWISRKHMKLEGPTGSVRPAISKYDREKFMSFFKKMYEDWLIDLRESLKPKFEFKLGLQDCPELLPPKSLKAKYPELQLTPSSRTTIEQVYEELVRGRLLIIGEAGSGKTTLFLRLGQYLVDQARKGEMQPIPSFFNLSSWPKEQCSFDDWLVKELTNEDNGGPIVPESVAQALVRNGRLLLLLDGLDEVRDGDNRGACVEAINTYLKEQFNNNSIIVPIVICCRSDVYRGLAQRLQVQRVVELLPPSDEEIHGFFQDGGRALEVLWNAIQNDEELKKLVRRPLMLSILAETYHGSDQDQIPTGRTEEEMWRITWDAYIKRMLNRRKKIGRWKEQQIRRWLTVLAKQMTQQGQPFRVESLQKGWLPAHWRPLFPWFMGVFVAIIVGIIVGTVFGVLMAVIFSILFGALTGILVNNQTIAPTERLGWNWPKFANCMLAGVVCGLICGALGSVLIGSNLSSILGGVFGGIAFAIINGIAKKEEESTRQETLGPNAGILQSARAGIVISLLSGVAVAFIVGIFGGVVFGTFSGTVFGILSGAEKVLRSGERNPGGIGRRPSGIVGAIFTIFIGVMFGILGGLVGWLFFGVLFVTKGIVGAVFDGIIFGIYFGVLDGGDAFFLHYSLRIFLWATNLLPLRLVAFLDEMDEIMLLRRSGGKYRFLHNLLMEHFDKEYAFL